MKESKSVSLSEVMYASSTAKELELTRSNVKALVKDVVSSFVLALASDKSVLLFGCGKFKLKNTPARKGRNPKTGEVISIPASRKVVFRPSRKLKEYFK